MESIEVISVETLSTIYIIEFTKPIVCIASLCGHHIADHVSYAEADGEESYQKYSSEVPEIKLYFYDFDAIVINVLLGLKKYIF